MSGGLIQGKTQGTYLPVPTGGLNLISPPLEIQPNEALVLQDYSIFSWGIRERGAVGSYGTISNSSNGVLWAMPYVFGSGSPPVASPKFFVISGNTTSSTIITNYDANSNTSTGLTYGGPNLGSDIFNQAPCVFDNNIYLGTVANNHGITWTIGSSTVNTLASQFTAVTGTGTIGSLFAPFAFKRRLYFIDGNVVWFGDPLAISGNLNPFDFSTLIQDGSTLLFCFAWGYNQGQTNDELFVAITNSGQIIIYSGDWPAASNWQLVAHTQIPTPSGAAGYLKQGQNVFIQTVRGIVSLKDFLAGSQSVSDNYYLISKNLGPIATFGGIYPVINSVDPFIYFLADSPVNSLVYFYTLNYELGAWSIYQMPFTAFSQNTSSSLRGLIADPNSKKVYTVTKDGTVSVYNPDTAPVTDIYAPTWQTPFLKLVAAQAPATQKTVSMVRIIARSITGGNGKILTSCQVAIEFSINFGATSQASTTTGITGSNSRYFVQEVSPPGQGRYLSFQFSKTVTSGTGELDEIGGIEVYWQDNQGAY